MVLERIETVFAFLFHGNTVLAVIFAAATFALVVAAIVSGAVKHAGVYGGGVSIVIGGTWLAVLGNGISAREASTCLAVLAIVGGILYLILFVSFAVWRKRLAEKKEREERARRLKYTLPDRENAYVRARLNTVLRTPNEPSKEPSVAEKYFRLEHARKMLSAVREKEISMAERLETDELSALLSLYAKKESVDSEDLRVINDAFSRVLKLSAKYDVALKSL
ncbi:MAG: hypothetical protein IJX91_05410 [Clostridia bacterium]|nr:hypothetical protein [Clostridia bacterium]